MLDEAIDQGGSWLSELWSDTKEVLTDGISIYQDIESVKNPPIMTSSQNPADYDAQFRPVDQQTIANAQVQADTWVPGVSNTVLVIGGITLAFLGFLAVKK